MKDYDLATKLAGAKISQSKKKSVLTDEKHATTKNNRSSLLRVLNLYGHGGIQILELRDAILRDGFLLPPPIRII